MQLLKRCWPGGLGLWLALLALAPAGALACGLPLEASIPSEQALIVFADGREEIIASVQLEDAGPNAAVVFPVPGVPEVDLVPSEGLFDYLATVTQPRVEIQERLYWSEFAPIDSGLTGGGVEVLGRDLLDRYDVARLAADDPRALQQWLDTNGYQIPAGAEPILQTYIEQGWTFVAVRLATEQTTAGPLRPLRMAFATQQIIYPMRLGALAPQPLDVDLYILADQRVEIDGLTTRYAGPVAQLDQAPPEALAPLFRSPYLTRLRNTTVDPATLTGDYIARPAATNQPFRQVNTRIVYVSGWERLGGPIRLGAALLVLNIIGITLLFWLHRRMQHMSEKRDH